MEQKFGFNVQAKVAATPVIDNYKIRGNSNKQGDTTGKLIEFDKVVREVDNHLVMYDVLPSSQSIKGLRKYFRKTKNSFIVEIVSQPVKENMLNCYKYRRGAMVLGNLKTVKVDFTPDSKETTVFVITGYLNV